MFKRVILGLVVVTLLVGVIGQLGFSGQKGFGALTGIVTDDQGNGLPGVTISVKNLSTNTVYRAVTDSSGRYSLKNLPVGKYVLEASMPGFKLVKIKGINVLRYME